VQALLNAPDITTKKGLRDRAIIAVLLGCGLRRSEVAALTLKHIQQRDGRWCIVDLVGKHGRVRTVPMPTWVKVAIDTCGRVPPAWWTAYAISFWMPQAVKSLSDYSNTVVGLLVMIPYIAGLATTLLVSRSSDRRLERRYHAAIPLIGGGIALTLLGTTSSPWLSITLWCLATMGNCGFWGPFWSLPSDSLAGSAAAAGIALITAVGSLGGFVGPPIVGAAASGPGGIYRGLAVAGVSFFVSAVLAVLLPKKAIKSS